MIEAGYSIFWVILSSIFIYAGSMQIVMISLLTSGVPLYTLAIMTFFINGRHIFYGIGFIDKFRKMGWKYPYMALTMTDETYSIMCNIKYPEDVNEQKVDFYIAAFLHVFWLVITMIGAWIGKIFPFDMGGIEFSATAFFVTVCVNQWQSFNSHIPAITGLISSVAFYFILGADNFILPALSISLIVLVIMRDKIYYRSGGPNNAN
jgi:4-azaleucine resistance transporter AzlC